METQKFAIETAQSNIDWVGRKVTGAHNGTISIKEGSLILNDGQLAGGEFTIDTTSIIILGVTDPATNAEFACHLASPDFSAYDTGNASGKVVVDRTLYNMKFRSGNFIKDLGDTLI